MYRGKRIAVVLPAYNEEKLIKPTIENVPNYFDEIIVVNDGSKDNTEAVVSSFKDKRITLINHNPNKGLGQSIITGYLHSSKKNNDITIVVGADFQMDLVEAKKFLDPIIDGKADFTKGNRFLYSKNIREDMPRVRFIGNSLLSFITKLASGYWKIFDSNDGYTAIKKEVIDAVDWTTATKRYGYNGDWMALFNIKNVRIMDIPRRPIYLKGERQSQIKIGRYIMKVAPKLLYRFFWRLKEKYIMRDFNPLVLFYFMGLLLVPAGLIIGIYMLIGEMLGYNVATGPMAILCVLFLLIGFQSFVFALMFDMNDNVKLCPQFILYEKKQRNKN